MTTITHPQQFNQHKEQTMTTLTDLAALVEFQFDPHLPDDPTPVLVEPQAQGDIYILPADGPHAVTGVYPAPGAPRPLGTGYDIVEGQGIRNPHTLRSFDDAVTITPGSAGYPFDVATLHVPDGAEAFLLHPEHGANGIGPGTYVLRRQREQAETVRAVAD